ncbi:MAG: helix-turn-helix transcriptional regulator [Clostridia bacterium]|nr:helix-turn-helix transcriptional regulator [Clostridia bacterium]
MKYEIGNRIRKYRKDSGLTQEQLAMKINVTKSRVSNWEQGINRPDSDIIGKICRALNVSPSDLLNVHLTDDELNSHEKKVINAYRTKQDLQNAVDILLGIDENTVQ